MGAVGAIGSAWGMAMASGFSWRGAPPSVALNAGLVAWGRTLQGAVMAVAAALASELEAQLRAEAPWQDVTGHARRSLRVEIEAVAGRVVTLYLIHGADYGAQLELDNAGQLAVIRPVLLANAGKLQGLLQGVLNN